MTGQDGYGPALSALRDNAGDLAAALILWASRDDSRAQSEVRRAANDAMDAADAMISELYSLRQRIMRETRISDDIAAARVDAMLARDHDFRGRTAPPGNQGPGARTPGPVQKEESDEQE
jgi:hypothetical protein